MIIEPLKQADILAAANVIAAVFTEKWRGPAIKEFTRAFTGEQHPTHVFVAKKDGAIIGIAACLETYFAEFTYGLCWVGVLEAYRRQGIARQLIERVETFTKNDLLQGKSGTMLLATDGPDYYSRMGYQLQPGTLHDNSRVMLKVL